jgi:3-methyladenine DNA glycosylase AlkD
MQTTTRSGSALAALAAAGDETKAAEMAAYHKAPRRYLGVANSAIDALAADWRGALDVPGRLSLARDLWRSDVHEARIAAAKLLTQARIRDHEADVWEEVRGWVCAFDGWAIADHACKAIERRLVAAPARLDAVEAWTADPNMWVRRAALVATLPWTKQRHPDDDERAARERVLGWAAACATDRDRFIQKAVGCWLRSLSLHDPDRVRAFLDGPGRELKGFARREALRRIGAGSARPDGASNG